MFTRMMPTALAVVVLVLSGCAFTPQQAELKADVAVAATDVGKGSPVFLQVVDERPSAELGRRGTGAMEGAAITTSQDIATLFRNAIITGLTQSGFKVVSDAASALRQMRVDIRLLEYDTSMGFWTGGVHTRAALKAAATDGGKVLYENLYREEVEERVVFVPGASENEQQINLAIRRVLEKMFGDPALLSALVSTP